MKGKILAVDFGTKRIGLAISDIDACIAFPKGCILCGKNALEEIAKIIESEEVVEVVFGLPLGLENEETPMSKKVKKFAVLLSAQIKAPIKFIDEMNSSRLALLKIPSKRDRKKRDLVDTIAAQEILERYLARS